MSRTATLLTTAVALWTGPALFAQQAPEAPLAAALGELGPDVQRYHEHVITLASPFMDGRLPGTDGMELAKDYCQYWLEDAGVLPGFPGDSGSRSWRQPFPLGDDLKLHPTVKPVALVADAIRDCSTRRGIVLDTFAGSGTTIIAAEKTGRRAYAMELDPRYVETTIRRWQDYAGGEAVHADTGHTFNALDQAAMRAREIGEAEHIEDRKPALSGRKGVSRDE